MNDHDGFSAFMQTLGLAGSPLLTGTIERVPYFSFGDDTPRWKVTITYKTISGTFDRVVLLEELEDLGDVVEQGPNFYSIVNIVVVLADPFALKPVELAND